MESNIITKGWGHEEIIVNNDMYCGKIMHFKKGKYTSMHFHVKKTETFYVMSGEFDIELIDTGNATTSRIRLLKGDKYDIQPQKPHRIIANIDGKLLEISTHDDTLDSYRVIPGSSQE